MIKKILSLLLAIALLTSLSCCAQNSSKETEQTDAASDAIETDENFLTVEITIPSAMFSDEDMSNFDADAYASEEGFLSAKVNDDGSVTATMTKSKHAELLAELTKSMEDSLAEYVESESTPYIKEITHNDDFTEVSMKVNREAYESTIDFTALGIGILVAIYQAFTETEYHVDIHIVDVATGETFSTVTLPEK